MLDRSEEWLKQSQYDYETASYMFSSERYLYVVFMCHLSVEKALKGLFERKLRKTPPRTHNLLYLLREINLKPDDNIGRFIAMLNEASITTRYPDDLSRLQAIYTKEITQKILKRTGEVLEWLKKKY